MFLTILTIAACLLACFIAAGWSVLQSAVFRRQMQALLGLSCIAAGSGSFFVLTSALIVAASLEAQASAGDTAWRVGSIGSLLISAPSSDLPPVSADEAGSSATNPQNQPAPSTVDSDQEGADTAHSPGTDAENSLNEPVRTEDGADFKVVIPPGRPAWVDSLPVRVGAVHTTAVSSGPHARQQDALHALDTELLDKTREYIVECLGSDLAGQLVRYDLPQIKAKLVKPENLYGEEIIVSIGPMHQQHALLEFGPEFRAELAHRWAGVMGTSRLLQMGLLVGGMLGLLGTVFGYFRADNATRGFYTGRLQAMAAVAILALVGAGLFFGRLIPWL
jgi:hypothetical protein